MRKKGQAGSEYMIMAGVALAAALVVAVLVLFTTSKGGSEIESAIYWQGAAKPIRVVDAGSFYGSGCENPGTGGYKLALENVDMDPITLTGVRVDGVPREFCDEGTEVSSAVSIGANEKAPVEVLTSESASPCSEGQLVSMELAFVYDKRYLSGHVQNGSKALVVRCSTPQVSSGRGSSGGENQSQTPTCRSSGQACSGGQSCCTGFVCNGNSICQACLRIGEQTCQNDAECCPGGYCNSGRCLGCILHQGACSPPGFGTTGCCSGICGEGGQCCVDNFHYSSNAQCSSDSDCCAGLKCNSYGECMPCGGAGTSCNDYRDCCTGLECGSQSTCMQCGSNGAECHDDFDCCSGYSCRKEGERNLCRLTSAPLCAPEGEGCETDGQCCSGFCSDRLCASCVGNKEVCDRETPCCPGFACSEGVCQP